MEDNLLVVYGIYDLSDPDRCRYVGLTSKGVKARTKGHWDESRRDRTNLPIVRWMRKRQKDDFELRPLEYATDLDDLKSKERKWIADMRAGGQADLNITDGGESRAGSKWTEAQKRAKSEAMKGKLNPMYGRQITPEQMAKRVAKITGQKKSDEQRSKMSRRVSGSGNPAAKIDERTVRQVMVLDRFGYTRSDIQAVFGLSKSIVGGILNGRTWNTVTGLPTKRSSRG